MTIEIEKLMQIVSAYDEKIHRQVFNPADWDMGNFLDAVVALGKNDEPRFVIDENNETCYRNLIKWVMCDPSFECVNPTTRKKMTGRLDKGLYIYGPTGTGKTVATNIIRRLIRAINVQIKVNDQKRALWWDHSYRCDELVERYMHGDSLRDVMDAKVLCLQDLGCEADDVVYMGNHTPLMRNLLSTRGEYNNNITIITSNIPLDSAELRERYGDRVVSRLVEMCNFLVLKGGDRRLKIE